MEFFENNIHSKLSTMTMIDYSYFFESNKCLRLINTRPITNTMFPVSDTISNTDTTPSPAEQPEQDGHDDGRLVNSTAGEEYCTVECAGPELST